MEGLVTVRELVLGQLSHQKPFILTACQMKTALFYMHVSKQNIYLIKDCWWLKAFL